jgi:hypothetical protein
MDLPQVEIGFLTKKEDEKPFKVSTASGVSPVDDQAMSIVKLRGDIPCITFNDGEDTIRVIKSDRGFILVMSNQDKDSCFVVDKRSHAVMYEGEIRTGEELASAAIM